MTRPAHVGGGPLSRGAQPPGREGDLRRGRGEAPARSGFDTRYGARPLKRAVEQQVVAPLARWLAAQATSAPPQVVLRVGAEGRIALSGLE
ncbi:hypothetical protein QEG98_26055 [Myxococcus sp. MxC21-1]|uniref:hypothetical protein n=1 Tax=Myxococcus sp. MxC21-1 TaxID=3041439 RepID=UPI00292DA345|nr:hypothetical protein [Myxococcus sp. MxC21-1]WNZ66036.1 hypothetical protein QEG98_26055 [Myxococcus sp. MxC21-1]